MKVEVNRVESSAPPAADPVPVGRLWPSLLTPPSRNRAVLALIVAVISDVLSLVFEFIPSMEITLDLATALVLWAILGWRWPLLPAMIAEAIPGVALFPTWTMVAGVYLLRSRR